MKTLAPNFNQAETPWFYPRIYLSMFNHWTSFNMAEGYGLICCVVPEWSDCFRCLHRGIRRVDASSVDTLPMVGLLPVATLWILRDLKLPSVTISSGKSLWLQKDMIIQSKSEGRKSGTSSPTLCPSCYLQCRKGRWRRSLDPGKSLPVFGP